VIVGQRLLIGWDTSASRKQDFCDATNKKQPKALDIKNRAPVHLPREFAEREAARRDTVAASSL
jgi:hypothetical protein